MQPYRVWEGSYPGYYIYVCQVVELVHQLYLVDLVWVIDKKSNALCLFFSSPAPVPRAICIGAPVAHFDRPFESRPVDPVRWEVYRQLATDPRASVSSGWLAPKNLLPGSPRLCSPGRRIVRPQGLPGRLGGSARRIKPRHQHEFPMGEC